MIGAQASVKISDLSFSTMLLVSFHQRQPLNLGCTSSIRNLIYLSVPNRARDVDPAEVLAAVPANLRKAFTSEQVPEAILTYMKSLKLAYAVAISMRCLL
jgi:hypothetical protein